MTFATAKNIEELLAQTLKQTAQPEPKQKAKVTIETEQEPVAWCQLVDGKAQDLLTSFEMKDWLYDKSWTPLYALPPTKRESLSDQAILNLSVQYSSRIELARAIEKAHGIGE